MLVLITILFPILAGIVLWRYCTKTGNNGHVLYGAAVLITDALAVLTMVTAKPVTLFTFSPRITFAFALDAIGKWFLIISLIVYTCILFYSFVYMKVQEREPSFLAFYFVSFGALIAVCCASNMVTIYFAFELTTFSTVPLVLHDQTKEAVAAGMKFLFYSVGGALAGFVDRLQNCTKVLMPVTGFISQLLAMLPDGIMIFTRRTALHERKRWSEDIHPGQLRTLKEREEQAAMPVVINFSFAIMMMCLGILIVFGVILFVYL